MSCQSPSRETVHRATTRQELDAVYRFRYEIYFEEYGRLLGTPDHARGMVTDADDEFPTTTILYTGTVERITGTVRLRHWAPGQVPQHDVEELSIDRFAGFEALGIGEIGRLMVRPSLRGQRILAALLRRSYQVFAGEHRVDLVFCYCSPALVRYYQHLAMRPFGGRLVPAPDGLMIPLVAVLSDEPYYRQTGSLLASEAAHHFGPGARRPLDLAPYHPLFADGTTGIELDPERVRQQAVDTLQRHLVEHAAGSASSSILSSLPARSVDTVLHEAMILDVDEDFLVTRQGFREREVYMVLDGEVTVSDRDQHLETCRQGQVFGQGAVLDPEARRKHTYRTTRACRLLVLRGRVLAKQLRRHGATARAKKPIVLPAGALTVGRGTASGAQVGAALL